MVIKSKLYHLYIYISSAFLIQNEAIKDTSINSLVVLSSSRVDWYKTGSSMFLVSTKIEQFSIMVYEIVNSQLQKEGRQQIKCL